MGPRCCLLVAVVFLVLPAALHGTCPAETCTTGCTGCQAEDKFADPKDCHRYYLCIGPDDMFPEPMTCPNEEVFDESCECSLTATCSNCKYNCESDFEFIVDRTSCSHYQVCVSGTPHSVSCSDPEKPYFDGTSCQADLSTCCLCQPSCDGLAEPQLIPDPMDCRRYFACTSIRDPPIDSGTCPSGQYFDFQSKLCSASASCVTLCKNMVGDDGCIDLYTCEAAGFFPKCPRNCTAEYYRCTGANDEYIEADSCPSGYVFHPDTLLCVTTDQCPY